MRHLRQAADMSQDSGPFLSPSICSRCTKSISGGTGHLWAGHQMEPMVLPASLPEASYFLPVVWKAELDSVFPCQAGPPSSTAAEAVRCVVAPGSLVEQVPGPRVLSLTLPAAPGCLKCTHLLGELSWRAAPHRANSVPTCKDAVGPGELLGQFGSSCRRSLSIQNCIDIRIEISQQTLNSFHG